MKYDCDLIHDIAVLYHAHALSPKSECAPCRSFFGQLDDSGIPPPVRRQSMNWISPEKYAVTVRYRSSCFA